MCGIAGVATFDATLVPSVPQVTSMCDTIRHRGPDDAACEIVDGVGLGMRRLAIIDVAGGRQPIYNEDRSVRVVFNGEIYNYRELRSELTARGHRFSTNSDTEVLVHLWEDHGVDFLDRLDGMFAIALHDVKQRRLLLARDHIGIKPFFYALDGRRLVFGSEVKAVLASGWVGRDLDVDALGQYMSWEYVPGPGTMFREIRKLEAGCLLDVDLSTGREKWRRYWDVPIPAAGDGGPTRSDEEWADLVDETVQRSVRRQMVSDVPLGAFLSGGVDSSLVVAGMGGDAKTFSIGFDDSTYNELRWAKRVAGHLKVNHDFEVIEPHVVDLFDDLMHYMDDPIGDFSIFPTFLVSRRARRHVTVALSGDGGDELFGGYDTYLAQKLANQWERLPRIARKSVFEPLINALRPTEKKKGLINKAKRFVEGFEHSPSLDHTRWRLFVGSAARERLFTPDALAQMTTPVEAHVLDAVDRVPHADDVNLGLYIDFKSYLVDDILVKVDRMSMATSLEARVPLLGREVVDLAFSIPGRLKVARGETKRLLREVAARHVPRECIYRPKEGFSIPIKHWLNAEFRPLMDTLLSRETLESEGVFNVPFVERLKSEHRAETANHSHMLWSMMVFQAWQNRWATG